MSTIQDIDYQKLRFDPLNPRLPEDLQRASPAILAQHYYEHSVITDLIRSMAANGFFPHEPLIVVPSEVEPNAFIVAEGNRRLTALCIIHRRDEADDLPRPDPELSAEEVERLKMVPCVVSTDQDAIRRFIGFRHISGPLTWEPEAKSRFLVDEIEKVAARGNNRPFKEVADSFGTNVQSVRSSYAAMKLLRHVREESGFDVSQIQNNRFGVWLRLMSSPEFREYISFNLTSDYSEIEPAIRAVNLNALQEVLSDLKAPAGGQAVLRDSRNATDYGRVLANSIARETLRATGDLEAAITIIDRDGLADRLHAETRRVEAISIEVRNSNYLPEVEAAAERLARASAALWKLSKPDVMDDLFPKS